MSELSFTSFSGTTRPTAFGTYDNDAEFQSDADNIVYYVQRELGSPVLDSELDLRSIWTSFEQATIEYSQTINSHHARNIMLDMLGQGTGSLSGSEQAYALNSSTQFARRYTMQYSHEFGSGGPHKWFTGSITTTPGQQRYDLYGAISSSLSGTVNDGKAVTVRKIHHYEDVAAFRFFDTTSVLNFMGNSLGFESYSPETIFYLLPIWEDVLRGIQLELNQRVRRSNYSFDLKGGELTLFPVPNRDKKLFFEYTISEIDPTDETNLQGLKTKGVMSNISNVAFGHIGYKDINSIGKTWIWRMTLAMCKEILGHIYSKYSQLPIPGQQISLNGGELIARGREDQANLRLELKELLDQMSYKNLMSERQELEDNVQKEWGRVPLLIYISK